MSGLHWAFLVDSVPFTRDVVDGKTSLGGSESSCIGLARALARRGHFVHIYATKLAEEAAGVDAAGVWWRPVEHFYTDNRAMEWDVVVSLRQCYWFGKGIQARYRILWNQDLLTPRFAPAAMAVAWAYDELAYVSEYHRAQWEDMQPELKPIGWVTRNGYDPTLIPKDVTKDPNRIIHVSRPERGLGPLLQMWPRLKELRPQATLGLCRYASMYDGEGMPARQICDAFDNDVATVNAEVGGIEWLGSLTKPQLMQEISKAAVMWYPGVSYFAETSCIAAIETQACGTPFVGARRGALPETALPSYYAGLLQGGKLESDEAEQEANIWGVINLMDGCAKSGREYRELQKAGREHVAAYTYDAVAAEWESHIEAAFRTRYESNKLGVLRQLVHEENRLAAVSVAAEMPDSAEAQAVKDVCEGVVLGREEGPEDYAKHAIADPLVEVAMSGRLQDVARMFAEANCTRVLDIACGNGSGAIAIAKANPGVFVLGVDYSERNIESAKDAAQRAGVANRCSFQVGSVYDFKTQRVNLGTISEFKFDGMFVGEFIEHVTDCTHLVDALEQYLVEGATVVYTCPAGPFRDFAKLGTDPRTHVHCFAHDDIDRIFGQKADYQSLYMRVGASGLTQRGAYVGHWVISYRYEVGRPTGSRDLAGRIVRTRHKQTVSLGMITLNAGDDLRKCLNSVAGIVDEIVIGDTGSIDDTKAIAAEFGAKVIDIAPIAQQPEGFAGARNAVLAQATGDWFMWIDADEVLMGGMWLRKYLDGAVFNGIVLHQQHLYLDRPPSYDVPVRVFRRLPAIKFYGVVHEQPQMGDCNTNVMPALEIESNPDHQGTLVVHSGYLTERIRRTKAIERNLPLVRKDQEVFPDRRLGKVFLFRDYVNLANWEVEQHGEITERARKGYAQALRLFIEHFDDPANEFHDTCRPMYETVLQAFGLGREYEWAYAGKDGGLGSAHAKPIRVWMRDVDEFKRWATYQIDKHERRLKAEDVPAKTDPFTLPALAMVTA